MTRKKKKEYKKKMNMRNCIALVLLLALAYHVAGLPNEPYVRVPGGKRVHKDCIHRVPSNALIQQTKNGLLVNNKQRNLSDVHISPIQQFHCVHTLFLKWNTVRVDDLCLQIHLDDQHGRHGHNMKIPIESPVSLESGLYLGCPVKLPVRYCMDQLLTMTDFGRYFWNGVEPADNSAVLQPVLQWGSTPAGGGDYWAVASWYVSSNHGTIVTPLVNANVGDTVLGTNNFLSNKTWEICGTVSSSGNSTCFNFQPYAPYVYAYEVLEAYSVDSDCSLYPPQV